MDLDALRARLFAIVADLCDGCASPDDVAQKLIDAGARGACGRPECPIADYVAKRLGLPELAVEVEGVGADDIARVNVHSRRESGEPARPALFGVALPSVARLCARAFDDGQWPELRIAPGRKRGPKPKRTCA